MLTSDRKYLDGAVRTCQTCLGANPINICYTSGLGQKSIAHPMNFDLLASHQPCPEGIVPYGPMDMQLPDFARATSARATGGLYWVINRSAYPDLERWPAMESLFRRTCGCRR